MKLPQIFQNVKMTLTYVDHLRWMSYALTRSDPTFVSVRQVSRAQVSKLVLLWLLKKEIAAEVSYKVSKMSIIEFCRRFVNPRNSFRFI